MCINVCVLHMKTKVDNIIQDKLAKAKNELERLITAKIPQVRDNQNV